MSNREIIFEEKQYMGHNRLSILTRSILALFCFLGYYWSENPKPVQVSFVSIGSYPIDNTSQSGLIFFLSGIFILMFSAGLTYILHIHTKVYKGYILIDGFWTTRKVKIDLNNITHIRRSRYKRNIFRRAVYNLHNKGIIKFYTSGEDFIELTDNSGFMYRIGTHRLSEFYTNIKGQLVIINNAR
ncbi:MAG: hypothetical protein IPI93_07575 [Sphingobacteriaceae bacterium]|nr:hypothetical protein [Sphingobacteriaceae bacterium]MBK7817735.1 hypothetical protein [Sphingobacteriaceae bacterium]